MTGKRQRKQLSQSPGQQHPPSPEPKQAKNTYTTSNTDMSHEEALRKQSEYIISLLSSKIEKFEERIMSKIDTDISKLKISIDDVTNRIKTIETKLTEIDVIKEENNSLKAQLKQHDDALRKIITRIERNEEMNLYKQTESDALVHGLPLLQNEDLKLSFNHLCKTLEIKPLIIRDIFRIKTNKFALNPPVIIKFLSPRDKSTLLRSISYYRTKSKKALTLRDFGHTSDNAVYIHECLTQRNRSLLQSAIKMKNEGQLFSAFTMRGFVYVKKNRNDKAIFVENNDILIDFATKSSMRTETAD